MIEKHLIPHQASGFRMENFDDEALLYHQVKTQAVYLNETAVLIWALCDGKNSIMEIEKLLGEGYPEAEDSIVAHISLSLERFIEIGAIEFK